MGTGEPGLNWGHMPHLLVVPSAAHADRSFHLPIFQERLEIQDLHEIFRS